MLGVYGHGEGQAEAEVGACAPNHWLPVGQTHGEEGRESRVCPTASVQCPDATGWRLRKDLRKNT